MEETTPTWLHRFFGLLVPAASVLVILHTYFLEPFQIPTGSMAPTLLGHHRSATCPRCGLTFPVGRTPPDRDGSGGERCYAHAVCPNCGAGDLHLGEVPETWGDHVLVDKALYAWRGPRRWEVVVFRRFGKIYIKRLVGLGGETIEIIDGDIYVDGTLARKTLDDLLGLRVLVFDNDCAPGPHGLERWETRPETAVSQPELMLDGRNGRQALTYRHYFLNEHKCLPILDELAYNAGTQHGAQAVHDFMVDAEVDIVAGTGILTVALDDGGLEVESALPVGVADEIKVVARQQEGTEQQCPRGAARVQLLAGKHYHIEMALVDRRLTLRIDGLDAFAPLDFPAAGQRDPVMRPLRLGADGVLAHWRHVRLYRDVHYTQAGQNAVHGTPLSLGADETFVLGDNSPNSEDSRFWSNRGAVPTANLVGRAMFVHLPSRAVNWEAAGRQWHFQFPDWQRVRWLK